MTARETKSNLEEMLCRLLMTARLTKLCLEKIEHRVLMTAREIVFYLEEIVCRALMTASGTSTTKNTAITTKNLNLLSKLHFLKQYVLIWIFLF